MVPLCALLLVHPNLAASPPTLPDALPATTIAGFAPDPALEPSAQQAGWKPPERPRWAPGQMVLQGFFGVNSWETAEVDGGSGGLVDWSEDDAGEAPVIGGGAQWKLGGERIDFGLEAMFSFAWRSNATAFVVGGSGAAVAVDVDSLVFEIYGGPVANIFVGDKARVYVSAGGLMEWVDYDQGSIAAGISDSGSGFGTGWYARTGFEFALDNHSMLGLGVRWSDSSVDLDGGLGDLDLEGFQVALTVTNGF
jgi:hypothetical protein